jgi:hypothetical protein
MSVDSINTYMADDGAIMHALEVPGMHVVKTLTNKIIVRYLVLIINL